MTQVIKQIREWKEVRNSLQKKSIGFVPTMGALHEGHLSLIRKSVSDNNITVVSIFVNPTQFNDKNDFKNYPVTFESDLAKLESEKVEYLFYPEYKEIYSDDFRYEINEKEFSKKLCGAHRPGHFTGVLTIVMKLLNIIKPTKAYFGEKDYQQYLLIKGMAEAFFLDCEIIPLPLIREKDGLAMSSRNKLLTEKERKLAPRFYHWLKSDNSIDTIKDKLEEEGFKIDYIEEIDERRFGAVHLGKVRLIDNVEI
jgi:pantoate--beta-alanine ligase